MAGGPAAPAAVAAVPNIGTANSGGAGSSGGKTGGGSAPRSGPQSALSARGASVLAGSPSARGSAPHTARSATASSGRSRAPLVVAPWAPERSNRDRPAWEVHSRRQQSYHRQLDEQVAQKAEQQRQRREEVVELEKRSAATLATSTHVWGTQAYDAQGERQVFKELLAEVEHRRHEALASRKAEQEEFTRKAMHSERQLAIHWETRRRREREELEGLANTWKEAAKEKQRRAEKEKADELKKEHRHIRRVERGKTQPRRLRKETVVPGTQEA